MRVCQALSQPVYTGKAAILGMLVRIAKLYGKTLAGELVPVVMLRDCLVVAPRAFLPVCICSWYPSLQGQIRQCVVGKRKHNTPSGAQNFGSDTVAESA